MFLDPLAVAYAALAMIIPPVRSKMSSALPESTKRQRLFKYQIAPQYKKACQKISSICHSKLKLAYDRFEEFVDIMSCMDVDIHDEKYINEHFAKGRAQIKEAASLLRSAYKGAFSAAVDLENFKDYERLQAYNLAFSCQLYLYFDDLKMIEKSFNRLLEQLYSDQHLKGHIKKYLQEKDGYTLKHSKHLSKISLCPYSKKAIYALQNIANHLKEIVHAICMEKEIEMEKRLLDAITKPVNLNLKYHRFFTCNWREDERYIVEQQILLMAAALLDSQTSWITGTSSSHLQITSKNLLTPQICIRGIAGSDLVCLNESKSKAIVYDSQNGRIVRISLTSESSGSQNISEVDFAWPEFISGPAKCVGLQFDVLKSNANRDALLALVWEREIDTRKCKIYLLSIEVNDKFAILAGHHVLAEDFDEIGSSVDLRLVLDSDGKIWCIIIRRLGAKSTEVKAYKMNHNRLCESRPQISILVDGLWSLPFIIEESLYILPNCNGSKCEKMLTFKLYGAKMSEAVPLTSSTGDFPPCHNSTWSEPCVISNTYVAVYIFNQKERTGAVWILNCKENMWTMRFELAPTHHIIYNRMSVCIGEGSKLVLHGECAIEFCPDAAHFLMLDVGSSVVDGTALPYANKSNIQSIEATIPSTHLQTIENDLIWFTDSPPKNNISTVEPMNFQRGGASIIVLGEKLYAIGGKDKNTTYNSCECYDPLLNEWKFIACMKHRRSNAGVTVLDGYIYVIGGFNDRTPLNSSERYCPKEDKWTLLPHLSCARGGVGATAMCGRIYAIGGYDGVRYLDSVEAYDPLINQWIPVLSKNPEQINFDTKLCSDKNTSESSYHKEQHIHVTDL